MIVRLLLGKAVGLCEEHCRHYRQLEVRTLIEGPNACVVKEFHHARDNSGAHGLTDRISGIGYVIEVSCAGGDSQRLRVDLEGNLGNHAQGAF